MDIIQDRLRNIFQDTINTDLRYNGTIENIDYFNLCCQAASKDATYRIMGSNFFMFNFVYESDNAILMIFSIPINSDSGTKHIAERVMEIIENTEKCFITLDYSCSKEVKDDKFVYVTIVKKYDNELIQYLKQEFICAIKKERSKKKNGRSGK